MTWKHLEELKEARLSFSVEDTDRKCIQTRSVEIDDISFTQRKERLRENNLLEDKVGKVAAIQIAKRANLIFESPGKRARESEEADGMSTLQR